MVDSVTDGLKNAQKDAQGAGTWVVSAQGPCTCPEDAIAPLCPRHEHVSDWWTSDPFKSRLAEHAWRNGAMPS